VEGRQNNDDKDRDFLRSHLPRRNHPLTCYFLYYFPSYFPSRSTLCKGGFCRGSSTRAAPLPGGLVDSATFA
jgi:hypothetical protein